MEDFIVKIRDGDDLRRISVPNKTLVALLDAVRQLLNVEGPFVLTYQDSEGDVITIRKEEDLAAFYREVNGTPKLILRREAPAPTPAPQPEAKPQPQPQPQQQQQQPPTSPLFNPLAEVFNALQHGDVGSVLGELISAVLPQVQVPPQSAKPAQSTPAAAPTAPTATATASSTTEASSQPTPAPTHAQAEPESESRHCHRRNGCGRRRHHDRERDREQDSQPDFWARPRNRRSCNEDPAAGAAATSACWRPFCPPSSGGVVHHGVVCDGCQTTPIFGSRFKCLVCPDFDLCGNCERRGLHDHHALVRLRGPMQRYFNGPIQRTFCDQACQRSGCPPTHPWAQSTDNDEVVVTGSVLVSPSEVPAQPQPSAVSASAVPADDLQPIIDTSAFDAAPAAATANADAAEDAEEDRLIDIVYDQANDELVEELIAEPHTPQATESVVESASAPVSSAPVSSASVSYPSLSSVHEPEPQPQPQPEPELTREEFVIRQFKAMGFDEGRIRAVIRTVNDSLPDDPFREQLLNKLLA